MFVSEVHTLWARLPPQTQREHLTLFGAASLSPAAESVGLCRQSVPLNAVSKVFCRGSGTPRFVRSLRNRFAGLPPSRSAAALQSSRH